MTNPNAAEHHCEAATVELELRLPDPLAVAELGARSEEILDALERDASEIALGAKILEDPDNCLLRVHLHVPGTSHADVLQDLGKIVAVIEGATELEIDPITVRATLVSVIHLVADE